MFAVQSVYAMLTEDCFLPVAAHFIGHYFDLQVKANNA